MNGSSHHGKTSGGLDLRTFERYGWGIDLDLAVRAREAGYGVYITEMAYINHFGHKTAKCHVRQAALCGDGQLR